MDSTSSLGAPIAPEMRFALPHHFKLIRNGCLDTVYNLKPGDSVDMYVSPDGYPASARDVSHSERDTRTVHLIYKGYDGDCAGHAFVQRLTPPAPVTSSDVHAWTTACIKRICESDEPARVVRNINKSTADELIQRIQQFGIDPVASDVNRLVDDDIHLRESLSDEEPVVYGMVGSGKFVPNGLNADDLISMIRECSKSDGVDTKNFKRLQVAMERDGLRVRRATRMSKYSSPTVKSPDTEEAPKGRTVTPMRLEESIKSVVYFTAADGALSGICCNASGVPGKTDAELLENLGRVTICAITLKNNFVVLGQSACADPRVFDAEKGRVAAYVDASRNAYYVLGYELRSKLTEGETYE